MRTVVLPVAPLVLLVHGEDNAKDHVIGTRRFVMARNNTLLTSGSSGVLLATLVQLLCDLVHDHGEAFAFSGITAKKIYIVLLFSLYKDYDVCMVACLTIDPALCNVK